MPGAIKTSLRLCLLLFLLSGLILPSALYAGQVSLAWQASNSPSPDGYNIYMRSSSSQYDYRYPAWTGRTTYATIRNLDETRTYYFIVRAYRGSEESSDSNEVSYRFSSSGSTSSGTSSPTTITIDDGKPGTSAVGTWSASGGLNPYGAQSLYSKKTGTSYTYQSSLTGEYEVSLWWTEYSSRCANVPVKIYDGSTLLETVYLDQRNDGGQWNYLGSYDFSGKARIVVESRSDACSTCADAVELARSGTTTSSGGTDIIIDDGKPGTAATSGWKISGGTNPYGSQSLWSRDLGATYTYQASLNGSYGVSLWWTEYSSRCASVPIKVYDGSRLLETVYADQRKEGGRWNLLGSYNFSGQARVVVESRDSDCTTCADAVKYSK